MTSSRRQSHRFTGESTRLMSSMPSARRGGSLSPENRALYWKRLGVLFACGLVVFVSLLGAQHSATNVGMETDYKQALSDVENLHADRRNGFQMTQELPQIVSVNRTGTYFDDSGAIGPDGLAYLHRSHPVASGALPAWAGFLILLVLVGSIMFFHMRQKALGALTGGRRSMSNHGQEHTPEVLSRSYV